MAKSNKQKFEEIRSNLAKKQEELFGEFRKDVKEEVAAANKYINENRIGGGNDWMSLLDDDLRLNRISIPGTHDAGAFFAIKGLDKFWKDQDRNIDEQLMDGIRMLDVRCIVNDIRLDVFHGAMDQFLTFNALCDSCYRFLNTHPSETIIMSVQDEASCDDIANKVKNVFDSIKEVLNCPKNIDFTDALMITIDANRRFWYTGSEIPKLGDVRGKIVLLRRFVPSGRMAGHTLGINGSTHWGDGVERGGMHIYAGGNWGADDLQKHWEDIEKLLTRAKNPEAEGKTVANTLFQTNCNVYNFDKKIFPRDAANFINPKLGSFFAANPKGRFGWVMMDFYQSSVVGQIIGSNMP